MDRWDTIRRRLDDFSRNVLFDRSGTGAPSKQHGGFFRHGKMQRAN